MDNTSSDPTHPLLDVNRFPQTPMPTGNQEPQYEKPIKENKISKRVIYLVVIIIILVFCIIGFWSYWEKSIRKSNLAPELSATTTLAPEQIVGEVENIDNKVVYIDKMKDGEARPSEIWIADLNGNNRTKLDIAGKSIVPLHKITSAWVYYREFPTGEDYVINAYNYLTKQNKQIIEKNQPTGIVNVTNIEVSPDSNKILYKLSYETTINCDPMAEGRQDPCPTIDLYPEHKTGTYVYDIESDGKVYLGSLFRSTQWTPDSRYIYTTEGSDYHEYKLKGGLYKIDVETGKSTLIYTIPQKDYYYYYAYPIFGTEMLLISENIRIKRGATGDGVLKIIKGNTEFLIDSGVIGANSKDVTLSPSGKQAVYVKDGKMFLIDFADFSTRLVLEPEPEQIIGQPEWVSSTKFITNSIKGQYPNRKFNIVITDINSNKSNLLLEE